MKKLIIVITLILALLFFGAPYYTGKVAETETLKLVDKINQSQSQYGVTEVLSYQRGVRSTTARYKYTPPGSLAKLSKDFGEIVYVCESDHGVLSIDYRCELEGESVYSKFVSEKLGGNDPLSVFGSISAFGGITQSISLDKIDDLEIDGVVLNFPQALLTVETDANASTFQISGGSDEFQIHGDGETLSMGKTAIDADFSRLADLLFTGDIQIEIEDFEAIGKQGQTSFKNLLIASNAAELGETLSSNLAFSIKQLIVPNMPLESVEDLKFSVDLKGLNKQALIEYQQVINQMQRDATRSLDDRQFEQAQMAKLIPVVENMLGKGLEVNMQTQTKLNAKKNSIAVNLKLLESLSFAQMPLFLTNPDQALKKLDLSLEASVDKTLVDSQPLGARFIANSPLIDAKQNDYSLNLKLGEKIELNGVTMSFAELQGLVLSSMPL